MARRRGDGGLFLVSLVLLAAAGFLGPARARDARLLPDSSIVGLAISMPIGLVVAD